MTAPAGIDPRGPRFAAWITSALLLVATVWGLTDAEARSTVATFGWAAYQPVSGDSFALLALHRATEPAFILSAVIAALFVWGIIAPRTQPWAMLFRRVIRPRLSPPSELEDPRPPRFAQGVGLLVVGIGLLLHLLGVPFALPVATAAAFVAAFLNAAFGFCLGCQLYLLLQRAGLLGRRRPAI